MAALEYNHGLIENKKSTTILSMDLSSSYDTIDTEILLAKLDHYGIRGHYNNLFRSYYTSRKEYVCIDNANSVLRDSLQCSIVQGSRLSSIMFNTYCNEIPLIPKLINTPLYHKLVDKTKLNITKVTHMVINFIDDIEHIRRYSFSICI